MPVVVVLIDNETGRALRELPDPNGGLFDAAGDFDWWISSDPVLPVWSLIDPYFNELLRSDQMAGLLSDIEALVKRAVAERSRYPIELRGLLRLRALAERCQTDQSLSLVFFGDSWPPAVFPRYIGPDLRIQDESTTDLTRMSDEKLHHEWHATKMPVVSLAAGAEPPLYTTETASRHAAAEAELVERGFVRHPVGWWVGANGRIL